MDFFKAIAHIAKHGPSGGLLASAAEAKVRICIYGSPEVISILRDVEASGPVLVSPESQAVISKLLKEMPKDSGMSCKGIAETDLERTVFGSGFRQGTASAIEFVTQPITNRTCTILNRIPSSGILWRWPATMRMVLGIRRFSDG